MRRMGAHCVRCSKPGEFRCSGRTRQDLTLFCKHTLQLWIAWDQHGQGIDCDERCYGLFVLFAQQRVDNWPGRIKPRAIKRRPKPYPLLTNPRAIARKDARKYGHPEKLK